MGSVYDFLMKRIKNAIADTRYESRQNGVGERGFSDYHVEAIMKTITPILEDIFDEMYLAGYESGKGDF